MSLRIIASILVLGGLPFLSGCGEDYGSVPEVPEEEVTTEVAELDAVHEVMEPMWHQAFPARDIAAIQASVPAFEPLLLELDAAVLPGILLDKEPAWEEGMGRLMEAFQDLKATASEGDEEGLLAAAEVFHMSYEGMVRIIRPVVPELDVFHRHLYGVHHYYGPAYDLDKILQAANRMGASIPPLLEAQLPSRLAERQAEFDSAVEELGGKVAILIMALENPNQAEVEAAIQAVHDAYQVTEAIFD
jgi:hypothetical protein